jgi:hypothetical protein
VLLTGFLAKFWERSKGRADSTSQLMFKRASETPTKGLHEVLAPELKKAVNFL